MKTDLGLSVSKLRTGIDVSIAIIIKSKLMDLAIHIDFGNNDDEAGENPHKCQTSDSWCL